MVAVSDAKGGAEQKEMDFIVRYASSVLDTILMARYQTHRVDYLVYTEELAHFALATEMETRWGRSFGKEVVAHVDESASRKETRTCHGCRKVGHLKRYCRSKNTGSTKKTEKKAPRTAAASRSLSAKDEAATARAPPGET